MVAIRFVGRELGSFGSCGCEHADFTFVGVFRKGILGHYHYHYHYHYPPSLPFFLSFIFIYFYFFF